MRNRVIKILDAMVEKHKWMSKVYVHSEFKNSEPHFDKKQPAYDTLEGLYTRYANVRRLGLVKNVNECTRKDLYMNYYKNNYRLSDYYMTLLNINSNKIQQGDFPKKFQHFLEFENVKLRNKILLLMDYPHLNKKLNTEFTFLISDQVNLDTMAPNTYLMSLLKNKVQGDRVYKDMIINKSQAQNKNVVSPVEEAKVAPPVSPRTQLTKEKLEIIKKQAQKVNENVQKTKIQLGREVMI